MNPAEHCSDIFEIRQEIDQIDENIVKLIAARAGYVKAAVKFKTTEAGVRDPERVKKVIESKKELAQSIGAPADLVADIYTRMIDYFVASEMADWKNK